MPEGYEDSHWISYGRVHVNVYAFTGKSPLRESTEYYRIPMEASSSRRAIAQGPRFQWPTSIPWLPPRSLLLLEMNGHGTAMACTAFCLTGPES